LPLCPVVPSTTELPPIAARAIWAATGIMLGIAAGWTAGLLGVVLGALAGAILGLWFGRALLVRTGRRTTRRKDP
jgi:membrane protein DedA with SNARE-associated domain